MNLYNKFSGELQETARLSPIKYPMAAALIHNNKLINKIRNNSDRSSFHGAMHSSLHAEMNVILDYYGSTIQWNRHKNIWCLLLPKGKER